MRYEPEPYMSMKTAAIKLGLTNARGGDRLLEICKKTNCRLLRVGRRWMVRFSDLEAALEGCTPAMKRQRDRAAQLADEKSAAH